MPRTNIPCGKRLLFQFCLCDRLLECKYGCLFSEYPPNSPNNCAPPIPMQRACCHQKNRAARREADFLQTLFRTLLLHATSLQLCSNTFLLSLCTNHIHLFLCEKHQRHCFEGSHRRVFIQENCVSLWSCEAQRGDPFPHSQNNCIEVCSELCAQVLWCGEAQG